MFRIISLFCWLILIAIPLIWFVNNNGWINITWLGYEVKFDILTFLFAVAFVVGVLFLIQRIINRVISWVLELLGFKADQLKKRDKIIKKYEDAVLLLVVYVNSINSGKIKEAKSKQKEIHSLLKNDDLRDAMLNQVDLVSKNDSNISKSSK